LFVTMKTDSFVLLIFLQFGSNLGQEEPAQAAGSKEIEPGVYSYTLNGAYISMFVITSDGVMVVDPMSKDHSEAMLAEIRTITNAPIKYLFYTHNHWDHTKGGQVWKNEGATIVSHIDAYDYIKDNPTQDLVLPDMKWIGDRYDITLGDTTVELHFAGNSHGNGMTTIVLPKERVGYIADLAVPNQVIFFAMPDFNVPGMIRSLEEYTKYPVDKIVFSHSANPDVLEAGTMENVRFTIQYIKDIQDAVLDELQKGTNPFTLWKTVKLPQYSNLAQYDNWFELNVLAVTISNVLGPLSWSPKSSSSFDATPRSSSSSSSPSSSSSSGSSPRLPTYNPNSYIGFNSKPKKSSNNNPWKSSNNNPWKSSSDNNPWKSNSNPWNSVSQQYSKYNNF